MDPGLIFGTFSVAVTLLAASAGYGKLRQEVSELKAALVEIKALVHELTVDMRRDLRELEVLVRGELAPRVTKLEEAHRLLHEDCAK